ncbi:MAG: flavodoxin [Lachnospiraceae bacterium]|nr:flavodoxin [Lachnospiraceae bacterium]
MKTLIIYTSQTGFTKKYAQWLAERMQGDVLDLKAAKKKGASFYDAYEAIVYAGWVMAGKVVKADWFFGKAPDWKEKRLAIMAVGGSPNDNPDVETAMKTLLTEEQRRYMKAFYCQGGFDHDKMKWPSKVAMKMFTSALRKKKDEKSRQVAEFISQSYDISDVKFIEPVASYLLGGS